MVPRAHPLLSPPPPPPPPLLLPPELCLLVPACAAALAALRLLPWLGSTQPLALLGDAAAAPLPPLADPR